MLGILRTTLALMVMVYHLYLDILPLGIYAVFGFYMISGYLMTLIMHETYGYTWKGRKSFAINRFLRLYPQYWAAALLSIFLIVYLGSEVTTRFHKSIYLPVSIENITHNISLAFTAWYPGSINPRLVPPSWALTVEIFFYLLICLGISKTFSRVKIWLFLSLCYVVYSYAVGWDWGARYFPVTAASLPFSIGALIYFATKDELVMRQFIKMRLSSRTLFFLMLSNCTIWIIATKNNAGSLVEVGFYLNVIIFALLVFSLAKGREIFAINRKIDKTVGDYSYPIYLLHWQCGLIASYLLFGKAFHELSNKGLMSLLFALVIAGLISMLFIRLLDDRIQRIRTKIKANNAPQKTLVSRAAES